MAKSSLRTTESQRAEHLWRIRDLVVLGIKRQIDRRSELQQVAIEDKSLRTNDGKSFNYTSVYRYLDALRFLKFDDSERYRFEDDIVWSPRAIELAKYGEANYGTEELSEPEKAIFRTNIFISDVSRQFLSSFCEANSIPHSQEQFITLAHPLYVVNRSVERPVSVDSEEWPAKDNVEISQDPYSGKVTRKSKQEFLYTYRFWCLDTDIIDELNVREAERCGIPKSHAYVLFPLDSRVPITPDQFLEMIYASLGRKFKRPQVVPVPWLMYHICPEAKISVDDFKSLLVETWQANRHLLHLERGPGGLIEGEINASERKYSERFGNHRYYPIVDGTIRSNVAIFPAK